MSQPKMKVICGWCNANLGTKPCSPQQAGQVSHGMCATCKSKMLSDAKAKAVQR
jgi:hypothetical protein